MMFLWLLGLTALGTAAGYWAWQRQRSADLPPTFAFRCPRCGQKLRYAAASQGRKVQGTISRLLLAIAAHPQPPR